MRGSVLASSIVLALAGCGAADLPPPAAPEPAREVPLSAEAPALAEGVVALAAVCARDAAERCDGLDSDCDGRIDEGCEGVSPSPGAMHVAVAWTGGAQVELVVTGPDGASLVARGECPEADAPPVAHAALDALAPGRYRVELVHAGSCEGEEPVRATLSVAVAGSSHGPFNRALAPGERAPVLEVELTPR